MCKADVDSNMSSFHQIPLFIIDRFLIRMEKTWTSHMKLGRTVLQNGKVWNPKSKPRYYHLFWKQTLGDMICIIEMRDSFSVSLLQWQQQRFSGADTDTTRTAPVSSYRAPYFKHGVMYFAPKGADESKGREEERGWPQFSITSPRPSLQFG